MSNWLAIQAKKFSDVKRLLTEAEFNPEYIKFPVRDIHKLLLSAEAEIGRLSNEVERMKNIIEESKKEKKIEG